MKKILLIKLAILTLIGMSFFACSDDDPLTVVANVLTAEFSIVENPEDDTKVSLDNMSQHAVSYHWSFGDGTTSTDENPTHIYQRPERETDYKIVLITTGERGNKQTQSALHTVRGTKDIEEENGNGGEDPEKPSGDFEIVLDGKFDDWLKVPAANIVSHELDTENSAEAYHRLKKVMLCANTDYIYLYMKMDNAHANAMDMYLNVDGKKSTGYNSWMWKDLGANYLMQATYASGYDMRLAAYDESKGGGWGWLSPNVVEPGEGLMECSSFVKVEGSIVEFEARIKRSMIPDLKKEIKISIGHSGADGDAWSTSGGMPTVTESDKLEPFVVKLP